MIHSEFFKKIKAQMDELDIELDRLEEKAQGLGAEFQEKYQATLSDLKEKRAEFTQTFKKYETATEGAADEIKQAVDTAWDVIKKGFASAKSEFKDIN